MEEQQKVAATILSMYITLMPVIIAGVANMKLLKTSFLKEWEVPMDGGRKWRDGEPLFGKNKTWRGAFGMVLCSITAMVIWGSICAAVPVLERHNHFYAFNPNQLGFNIVVGLLLGVAYILFELPNSFWKRRRKIEPGTASEVENPGKYMWLDQMDSLFGCALIVAWYYPLTIGLYLGYVFLGAATHLLINWMLVSLGWKKSI